MSRRLRRLAVVTLTFLCAGPVIQGATEALLTAASLLVSGEEVHWVRGIAPRFVGEMAVFSGGASAATGLLAGVCEMWFGPLGARGMLAVSLVVPAALLALLFATVPPFREVVASGDVDAVRIFLGPTAIAGVSFVVSMMACSALAGAVTGRIAAARSAP